MVLQSLQSLKMFQSWILDGDLQFADMIIQLSNLTAAMECTSLVFAGVAIRFLEL